MQTSKSRKAPIMVALALITGTGCIGQEDVIDEGVEVGSTQSAIAASLSSNRDRLLDTYAALSGQTRCTKWSGMSQSEKGVFLTITDLLGKRSWLYNDAYDYYKFGDFCSVAGSCNFGCEVFDDFYFTCEWVSGQECWELGECDRTLQPRTGYRLETALDHVTKIYAVNGQGGWGCTPSWPICCSYNGGGDNNRMYFATDSTLGAYVANFAWGLPAWGKSGDGGGPHPPFTNTSETHHGQPRGQVHFFAWPGDAVVMSRPGVAGVYDQRLVEIDIDYNFCHDSNPEAYYGGVYGRTKYQSKWWGQGKGGSAEYSYAPSCGGGGGGGSVGHGGSCSSSSQCISGYCCITGASSSVNNKCHSTSNTHGGSCMGSGGGGGGGSVGHGGSCTSTSQCSSGCCMTGHSCSSSYKNECHTAHSGCSCM